MEDILIEEYAKKSGMDASQAKAIWNSLKNEEDKEFGDIKDYLANVVDLAETAKGLPSGTREDVMQKIPFLAMGGGMGGSSDSSSKWQKLAEDVTMFREMMKTIEAPITSQESGNNKSEELVQKIESLEKKLFETEQDARFDELKGYIAAVAEKIDSVEETKREPEERLDVVDSFLGKIEDLESKKERFKRVGLLSEPEQKGPSEDEAEKILKERGYRIEKPTTITDVEGFVEKKVKEKEEEIRNKVLEDVERQEKRQMMYLDLVTAVADGALSAFAARGGNAPVASHVQEFKDGIRNAGNVINIEENDQ